MRFSRALKPRHTTFIGGCLIGLGVTLLMLLVLQSLPFFANSELSWYDWQFNHRGSITPSKQILVVGVDPTSISFLSPGANPVRRYWVGQAIRFLCHEGVKAIGIDFSYFNHSVYDVYTHGKDSRALGAAIATCNRVVLNEEIEGVFSTDVSGNSGAGQSLAQPIPAIAPFAGNSSNFQPWIHLGVDNVEPDADNVVRQAANIQYFQQLDSITPIPSMPVVLASIALHKPVKDVLRGLPNPMLINYVGKQAVDGSSTSWLVPQFINYANPAHFFEDQSGNALKGRALRAAQRSVRAGLANKIVLIIPDAIVSNDSHKTPFGDMFGGFIQANTLNTLLHRNPIIPAGSGANGLVIIILGLSTTVIASRFGIWHSIAATIVLAIGYPIATIVAFSGFRYWLHLPTPEATFVLVLAAIMAFRFATEERQKRHAHQKFGLYLKPEIVDIIVNSPGTDTTLEGVRRPLSVLFVDIRGFTAMSEHMNPEDVVKLLDIYLEELTESVQQFDGTLDKYVGDEVMGVWNAPRLQPDHAMLAVKSALDMINRLEKINAQLTALRLPSIRYGIGVNTGEGIVGEMGSSFRKQYDAIGDAVNTAARLCGAAIGGEIIIGQNTWEILGNYLEVEETEPLSLKGKSEKLRTFRVIGIREAPLSQVAVEEPTATTA